MEVLSCVIGPPDDFWRSLIIARQVGADVLPALPFVFGLHQHVGADVERLRIVRRKDDGEAPLEAVFQSIGAIAHGIIGPCVDVAHLAGVMILARNQVAIGAGIDDFGIARIGRNPAALAAANVIPIAIGDSASGRARGECARWCCPAARRRRDTENRCRARHGKTARLAGYRP